jgi:two-component system chemotaxis response regulator CheY
MKILLADDDFISRKILIKLFGEYGEHDVAVDGEEVINAVSTALRENRPYDLICLDIIMPNMDGQEALRKVRELEAENGILPGKGAKIIMTTGMKDRENIMDAFNEQCDAYLVKPFKKETVLQTLNELNLLNT